MMKDKAKDSRQTFRLVKEALVVSLAYFAYYVVRSQAANSTLDAFQNAKQVIAFESRLGLFEELALQTATLSHDAIMHLSNVVYFYSHWPVVIVLAIWLFFRRPKVYSLVRNAFLITGAMALVVYFAFPVAPPWQTTSEVIYTLKYSIVGTYKDSAWVNPYAAVPSMRVGIDLLIAIGMFMAFPKSRLSYLWFLFPLVAWISTVTTGMHYMIDGLAGMTVSAVGFALAVIVQCNWRSIELRLPNCLPILHKRQHDAD